MGNITIADFMIIAGILLIIAGIVFYLYRAKKRGETCIGCPHGKQCGKKGGNCSDKAKTDEEK